MRIESSFRTRLRSGERLYGTLITLNHPSVAEVLAARGFDWLFVDGEHSPFDSADLRALLQAVAGRSAVLFRVPAAEEMWIKRSLDLGATGIIVPQINSAAEARRVVELARYAPHGRRGVGIGRAHGYGARFAEYMQVAEEQTVLVVQAEHIDAVNDIEAIAAVPGVDAVLVGPYDLSASLGMPGQTTHPDVVTAIDKVTRACRAQKMPLGFFSLTPDGVRPYIERGYTLLGAGLDTMMLGETAAQMLADLRQ